MNADARAATTRARHALDDGRQAVSYDEIEGIVEEEGDWLAARGERFALLADNGVSWAVADLALHRRSLPCVPLPGYFTPGQLQHALDDSGIDGLLTDDPSGMREWLQGWTSAGISGRTGLALFRRRLDEAQRTALPPGTTKVTYTSGSTGTPKGVCLGAGQLEAVARSLAHASASLGIERHLCLLPLATLLENIAGVHAPLLTGATCLLPPATETGMSHAGPDVPRLLACIDQARPQSLVLVPELLRLVVTAVECGWQAPRSLRFVAVGGAPVSLALLSRAEAAGLPVFEGYGLSECASVVCLNTPAARRIGSVGRPLPHARVRVGDDGELFVSGVTMHGYLGDPPRRPDAEWATGDLGEIDADGYVHVRGRLRNVYITSFGRNVAPEWVEREVVQQPGIRNVLVHGESRPYAVALVSAAADEDDSGIDRSIAAANARLPDYAQVRRWARSPEAFTLENGLLTSNGRLRRAAILERHGALLDALYRDDFHTRPRSSMSFHEQLARDTAPDRDFLLAAPVIQRCLAGEVTRELYIAFLTQAYHHVRHTVPLMMALGARLPERHGWLQEAVLHYLDEEAGHDQWILNDIENAGGDRGAAAASEPAVATDAMVACAYDTVMRRNPVGFFGMVHVLEGTSVALALQAADRIQRALDLPSNAFSYLRSHGELDKEHVNHLAGILARFSDAEDRAAVVRCARSMYWLYGQVFRGLEAQSPVMATNGRQRRTA